MKKKFSVMVVAFFMTAILLPAVVSAAGPININYVTMFVRMHGISKVLFEDLKEVEKRSNGRLKFTFRGGPEAIKVFDQAMAVRKGAVDMCMTSPDFYGKMVKGMEMLDLSKIPVSAHRDTGLYDFLNTKYPEVGLRFIMMVPKEQGNMFHFYTSKNIKKPEDFKGLSLAGTGIFDAIGPALGMTPVAMEMAEQYTAMERGLIDVCRGGLDSVPAFKFYEVADYIIKPGFGSAPASLFMNLKKWDSLGKELQDFLVDTLYEMAPATEAKHIGLIKGALAMAKKNGMEVVEFQGADREKYLTTVEGALYEYSSKDDPETAKKVFELTN